MEPPSADTIPSQPSPRLPFRPGERLTYSLTYTGIPLATMKLHLQDGPVREGNPTFEITGSLKTHGVASWIVSIDDRVRSIVNKDPLFSWSFTHRENHNGDRKVESSRYDHHRSVVMDHKNDTTPVEHPVHDPISALYALRVLPLTGLASRTHQVFLDGELYSVKIERQDREQLHTVVGRVWAHKLHVTTSKDDLKKTMKEGHAGFWIWVTEERGLPVQIRIPAAVGSIWAELSAYSPGRTATQD